MQTVQVAIRWLVGTLALTTGGLNGLPRAGRTTYTVDVSGKTKPRKPLNVGTEGPQDLLLQHSSFLAACRDGNVDRLYEYFPIEIQTNVNLMWLTFELLEVGINPKTKELESLELRGIYDARLV